MLMFELDGGGGLSTRICRSKRGRLAEAEAVPVGASCKNDVNSRTGLSQAKRNGV